MITDSGDSGYYLGTHLCQTLDVTFDQASSDLLHQTHASVLRGEEANSNITKSGRGQHARVQYSNLKLSPTMHKFIISDVSSSTQGVHAIPYSQR